MLTSIRNPKVQWVRSLQTHPKIRREAGMFVVEGIRLVEEAFQFGLQPELVFYTEDISERGLRLVFSFRERGVSVELVSHAVMKASGDTETSQGILAVLPIQPLPLPDHPDFVLILDGLRDPGNLGTILRTAGAAGVQCVLLTPGTTDAFAPKVVRSAMGAHFRIPLQNFRWQEIQEYIERSKFEIRVFLADSASGEPHTDLNFIAPLALIIGSEAEGAGNQARQAASQRVHIPMPGKSESLNAGVAAAILLFEVVRQRLAAEREDKR